MWGGGHRLVKVTSLIEVRGVGSEFGFLMCGSYQRAAALERWPVAYWSALTASKWCCKKADIIMMSGPLFN